MNMLTLFELHHELTRSPKLANAIAQAADDVIAGKLDAWFIVDPIQGGAGTSINMNTNEVIANRALELLGHPKGKYEIISPNSHVNMAQSTNDSFPTGIHLATLDLGKKLVAELELLHGAFAKKEKEFEGLIKMGRTHIQDAVPIRLGQEFGAYRRVIGRDLERIRATGKTLVEVNMGATAVGTATVVKVDAREPLPAGSTKLVCNSVRVEITVWPSAKMVERLGDFVKEMIALYNSWLTTMVNSSNNFNQELEKMQQIWKNSVEEQMGISREILQKMVELFKQGEKK